MKTIEFFFDLSSPYSYLASTQLGKLAAKHGAQVSWRPMVLAAVFKAAENRMPAQSPPKAAYMLRDLRLWAEHYGVPFQMNHRFPVNAIHPMRLILVAARVGCEQPVGGALFESIWAKDQDITDRAVMSAAAASGGLDPAAALLAIEEPAIKDQLRANTDDAIARGAFGAPALFVGDQLFWGNDRLHFLEAALAR